MISKTLEEVSKKYFTASQELAVPEEMPRIHVDEIAARVAKFYERVRSIVDYQDEHRLRKSFVNRVFRRRLLLSTGAVGENIIKETIRAGHLPNDTIPDTKITEVNHIIKNYRLLAEHLPPMRNGSRDYVVNWLTQMASNAIEEALFPATKDLALADLMFQTLRKHIVVRGAELNQDILDTQVFIAVQRALLNADSDLLHYRIFSHLAPHWQTMHEEGVIELARRLPDMKRLIDRVERYRYASQFFRLANRYNTVFYLIGDIMSVPASVEGFKGLIENESELESEIHRAYNARFKRARSRLNRLAFLSVISFLISKIAIAIAIEIPLETYLSGGFSLRNTLVNVILPPLLMFFIVMFIRLPGRKNFQLVMHEIRSVVSEGHEPKYLLEIPKRRNGFTEFIVQAIYGATIVTVFYYLIRTLISFGFSTANIVIFIFFVSMVAATGVKIHNRAKDLSLEKKRASFIAFLLDLISMPFVFIGRWILAGLAKFNPIVLAINLIIEAPFQVFISFLENFRGFIKAKKEEIT